MNVFKKLTAVFLCLAMIFALAACGEDNTPETQDTTPETTQTPTTQPTQPEETEPEETEPQGTVIGDNPAITLDENGNVMLSVLGSDEGNPLPFRVLSVDEMVAEMGTGWNLGNTMDGHSGFIPNETLWQDTETTQALINAVHDLGFNTVRIPITWGNMINEDYSINEKWISRVQDIVDYCIRQDMYVIINLHHDGADQSGWLNIATSDMQGLYIKYAGVWNSIATYFRDYDEHLIFESMNEVYGSQDYAADNAIIMQLNQIFINVVRSSGGNNGQRWLSVPGRYTNTAAMTEEKYGFEMPQDVVEDRLFAAVHWYNWYFGMCENVSYAEFTDSMVAELVNDIQKLSDRFTSQGIPVIMGEYGVINKNNPEQRAYHNEIFNLLCKKAGIVPVYWDQGWYDRDADPVDYSFTLVDRVTCESIDPEVTDALMRGFYADSSLGMSVEDITLSPAINPVTVLQLADEKVELTVGDVYQAAYAEGGVMPEDHNDVLLWSTDNYNVATVHNGMIRARGIGTATITVRAQNGDIQDTITVTVNSMGGDTSNAELTVGAESYTLVEGKWDYLNASITGAEEGVYLTYSSSDESVVTVNQFGKIVAVAPGTAEITVMATNGMNTTVSVTVEEYVSEQVLRVALNVLFNDDTLGCFNNETGPVIEITGDGQYTVTFDFASDASDTTKGLGVTGLNNLTAIYIKDYDVTLGNLKKSNLNTCLIRWDSVVVDGVELTLNTTDFKSAIKASGIFDTNDPFNSWDGSAVEEVTVSSYVLNILMDNPQSVTVTFTISGLEFAE